MSLPELVTIHTSLLTDLADAVRERYRVSGDLTIPQMTALVKPHLPSGYTAVDYLEANGSQFINANITGINGVYVDFQITQTNNGNAVFGGYDTNTQNRYDIVYWDGLYFSCGNGNDVSALLDNPTGRKVLTQGIVSNDLVVNDTVIKTYPSFTNTTTIPMLVFARKDKFNAYNYGRCKIWACKFYINGEAVRDFIPCYRKSDNVIGMYDIINETFYTNVGSGSFTCYPSPT